LKGGSKKAQVAVDFLSSYGIAILIMVIAIAIAYKVSTTSPDLFPSQCTPIAAFSCGYFSLTDGGVLTIGLAQATGGAISVKGIACSTLAGTSGMPAYGNTHVTAQSQYYPTANSLGSGVIMQSAGQHNFDLYCYGPNGVFRSSVPGASFAGYVWLNYTIQNTNIQTIQQVASLGLDTISNGTAP